MIAHHFEQAARFHARQAVTYAVQAGDHAMSLLAFENAVALYRSALASLRGFGDPDARLESRILVALGRAHQAAYQRGEAMAAFRRAGELAVSHADGQTLADAALGLMVSAEFSTTDEDSIALFRRALAAFHEADESLRARLAAGLAWALPAGDPEAASRARAAVGMARRVNQPATLAWALWAAVLVTWSPDNLAWRRAATDEVIALADQLGWPELAMDARNWRSAMLEELADFDHADADRASVERWAAESRRPFFAGLAAMRRAERALLQGRYRDAEDERRSWPTCAPTSARSTRRRTWLPPCPRSPAGSPCSATASPPSARSMGPSAGSRPCSSGGRPPNSIWLPQWR